MREAIRLIKAELSEKRADVARLERALAALEGKPRAEVTTVTRTVKRPNTGPKRTAKQRADDLRRALVKAGGSMTRAEAVKATAMPDGSYGKVSPRMPGFETFGGNGSGDPVSVRLVRPERETVARPGEGVAEGRLR